MRKHYNLILLAIGICTSVAAESNTKEPPELFLMNRQWLALAKTAIADGDHELSTALASLLKEAETALDAGPFAVTNKTLLPPSGDKHDYMSIGPYWWPNPDTADGLPYVRRDGEMNPESYSSDTDRKALHSLVETVPTLALSYYFTGEERYAERAALLLQTWFLNEDTRMNPHLQYGQAIPGRVEGRGIGIIDTRGLPEVVDAAQMLLASASWTQENHEVLKEWFAAYLDWLKTSQHGRDERNHPNNHGTWYDVQVACFALFVGDRKTATETLQAVGERRISRHISADGRQERELARTRSFEYSVYNLQAMFFLARLGEHVDVDLWHYQVEDVVALRAALDYLIPFIDDTEKWPHEQITEFKRASVLPILRHAFLVYDKHVYKTTIQEFSREELERDRSQLLYPMVETQ